ncbi:uncharacterized protein I303_102296 [Kwoniella dejecticola CBS 10117]|uniref:Diphthine--ammonia ligase n=1 Tax=Kwoniella dejecticola CBS 10117 TaxID=1296121 RepID=A0A1A6ABC7_9TREE|nr:cytoplasmic protein [Kwoniella dejecticola CBS 10117]OBR87362.1 cytoplasmic protein [Kwoniella dejecticola CBS 10117]
MSDPCATSLPGTKHKVIGLVSGGKDSCFNLMHCVANGHKIVALATLTPEPGVDELDSHLYQSVGTNLIHLIAKSMDLPLYTRVIKGKAVSKGPEYGSRLKGGEGSGEGGDETEDLTKLLVDVMAKHPEATALSSGAILSTYQRLRIEHVCSRLNLVSLAYLWQSKQMPLLERMLSCGMEVVLMKVAGVGLGTEVVGKQLADIMPLLRKLEARYGSHPAGEGGEYETFTLSTPLFSHRIKLKTVRTIVTDPEPYPVAYLKIEDAELEEKEGWVKPSVAELRDMLGLDNHEQAEEGLDEDSIELLEELKRDVGLETLKIDNVNNLNTLRDKIDRRNDSSSDLHSANDEGQKVRFARQGRWFSASISGITQEGEDVGQELRKCFDDISETLKSNNLSLPLHTTHITLLLSSMSLFVPANEMYKTYFGTSPPSRATVAVPLASGRVRIEIVGFDDTLPTSPSSSSTVSTVSAEQSQQQLSSVGGRNALHVQGLSYWAPANIGPYSQAVMVNQRLHLAGQIPLLPPSLTLPIPPSPSPSPYPHQAILALQHVSKIIDVLRSKNYTGGGWEGWVESCTAWWASSGCVSGTGSRAEAKSVLQRDAEGLKVFRKAWELWIERNGDSRTPVLFVQAEELPKSALVEYQVNVHTGRRGVDPISSMAGMSGTSGTIERGRDDDAEEDDEDHELEPIYEQAEELERRIRWEAYSTTSKLNQGSRGVVFVRAIDELSRIWDITRIARTVEKAITVRIYHLPGTENHLSSLLSMSMSQLKCNYTLIPVLSIHDKAGEEAVVALEIFGI